MQESFRGCFRAPVPSRPALETVNKYQQSWDVPNLFSLGASSFPQNGTYNYTNTLMAMNLYTADAIRNRYLKNPGPLA